MLGSEFGTTCLYTDLEEVDDDDYKQFEAQVF